MKKGFTLVELLAVITLLAVIGLIAVPVVNRTINSSKEKAYNAQVEEIKNAARSWASEHLNEVLEDDVSCPTNTSIVNITTVTVDTLKNGGYIPKKAKSPKNDTNLSGYVSITYDCEYNSYEYEYQE